MSKDKNIASNNPDFLPPPEVISLCRHRKVQALEQGACQFLNRLRALHRQAVSVHNGLIDRAEVSILAEFCRTTGLCFENISDDLQATVIIPATLYGDSEGKIFGKAPLQKEIARTLSDDLRGLFEKLNAAPRALWEYQPRPDEVTDHVIPLAGAATTAPTEVVGAIVRRGAITREPGVYFGWLIEEEDFHFLAFACRLDPPREQAVRGLLKSQLDQKDPHIWHRLELPLLYKIIDPDGQFHRLDCETESLSPGMAIRRPASRRGLILSLRRALWRHFAEPAQGLTIHAHIAALFDDREAFTAFLEEVEELQTAITIRNGGLPPDTTPPSIWEILAPFGVDSEGRLCRPSLDPEPAAYLLTGTSLLEAAGLDDDATIDDVRAFLRSNSGNSFASHLHCALLTYQTEQNLIATYGPFPSPDDPPPTDGDHLSFARRSAVLPNIRTLFDPRFMAHSIADLDLPIEARRSLDAGLRAWGTDARGFTLDDIPSDERWLLELPAVGLETCNAVRTALLKLGRTWRRQYKGW